MSTPDFEATSRTDSLGVDEEDLADGTDEAADGADGGAVEAADGGAGGAETPDGFAADASEPVVVDPDPDEYSDQPHMGSVPRVQGEDEYMPDTQGQDPIYAELGEEGQGDLAPEDL